MDKSLILLKMKSELWLSLLHFTSWMLIFFFFFSRFFCFCSFSFFKYLNVTHRFWVLTLNVCVGGRVQMEAGEEEDYE